MVSTRMPGETKWNGPEPNQLYREQPTRDRKLRQLGVILLLQLLLLLPRAMHIKSWVRNKLKLSLPLSCYFNLSPGGQAPIPSSSQSFFVSETYPKSGVPSKNFIRGRISSHHPPIWFTSTSSSSSAPQLITGSANRFHCNIGAPSPLPLADPIINSAPSLGGII